MKTRELKALLTADLKRLSRGMPIGVQHVLSPRFVPVLLLRLARFCYLTPGLKMLAPVFTWSNVLFFGLEVTPRCRIGGGLFLPHTHGTVIGAYEIGAHVDIYQNVTLGAKFADLSYSEGTRPRLADGVVIGAGAKVLGDITIGRGAKVAANSLVIESVPPEVTVIGVPAVVKAD